MSGLCIRCGQLARYSVNDVYQHKGECPPLPPGEQPQTYIEAEEFIALLDAAADEQMQEPPAPRIEVTEVRPDPPEPEPEPEPLPEPAPEPVPVPVARRTRRTGRRKAVKR